MAASWGASIKVMASSINEISETTNHGSVCLQTQMDIHLHPFLKRVACLLVFHAANGATITAYYAVNNLPMRRM